MSQNQRLAASRSTSRGCLRFSAGARVDLVAELTMCDKAKPIALKHERRVQAKSADDE